jgi:hypothetical protein
VKALTRSSQLEICTGGRCSSQARAESEKNKGEVADDEVVIVRSTSHSSGLVSPEYLVMVVGVRNRVGNGTGRMAG